MPIKKWLKGIWNFFFPKKKDDWFTDKILEIAKEHIEEFKQNEKATKEIIPELPETLPVAETEKEQEEIITVTKNEYRKAQLRKGFEARYSGKEKHFYLHKINYS